MGGREELDSLMGLMRQREPDLPAERRHRARALAQFVMHYRDPSPSRADALVHVTAQIPLFWLCLSLQLLMRTHLSSECPTAGWIWKTAKTVSGMDRQQYVGPNHYATPKSWPKPGFRHGSWPGSYERLPVQPESLLDQGVALLTADGS